MKFIYRIWCEWDIGQDFAVYASKEAALKSIETDENILEILQNDDCTLEDLFTDGLIGVSKVRVIE